MSERNISNDTQDAAISMHFELHANSASVLHVDSAIRSLLGYDPEELVSAKLKFAALIHKDDKEIANELFSLQTQQSPKTINFRCRQVTGKIICLHGSYVKQPDKTGTIHLQLQLKDAKSLKQKLNDLVLLTNFTSMMENSDDYIYFKDRNHVFTGASQTLVTLTDPSEHWTDLIGLTDYDVFPEEYADNYYRLEKLVFSGHVSVAHEAQQTLDNYGNQGWIDNRKYPIKDKSGNIIGLFGIARDVTANKMLETALKQSEQRFRDLFVHSPDPCWIVMENKVVDCNKAALSILGYHHKNEVLSLHPAEISPEYQPDGSLSVDKADQMTAKAFIDGVNRFEWEYQRRDGSCFPVEVTLARIIISGQQAIYGVWHDISERKQAERQLRKNESLLHTIFEQAAVGVALIDTATGQFERINQCYCDIVGYSKDEMLSGKTFRQITHPNDLDADLDNMARLVAGEIREFSMEKRYFKKNGAIVWVNLTVSPIWKVGEPASKHIAVVEDISERKATEDKLRLTAKIFESALEGILVTDLNGTIVDVNPSFCELTGYQREEVLGKNPRFLKSDQQNSEVYADIWQHLKTTGQWRGELWNRKKNGEPYAELLTISAITDNCNEVSHYVGIFSDITKSKRHQLELEQIAHFDSLTGVPNRVLLEDRLHQALAHHQRTGKTLAICYLDLDGFKPVNDTLGHEAGDTLLQKVTQRLVETVRSDDTVARIGGDEFVLLLGDFDNTDYYELLLHRLIKNISEPCQIRGKKIQVTASIGVTFFPGDHADADLLLRHADQAMYVAKTSGKGRYHIFDPAIELRKNANAGLINKINQALQQQQLVIFYQPQVDCRQGKVVGMEALLRWQHPLLGLRSPGEFLPIIEHDPLIVKIGEWLIEQALSQLQQWSAQRIDITISVNIAAKQLLKGEFVSQLQRLLQPYPQHICSKLKLEITETAALDDISMVSELIEQCRKQFHVEFALDDFGTGYSTLVQLKKMAANEIKIDQSFIADILHDSGDLAIVKGIISLADAFHQQVVAEGVESIEQLILLQDLGCNIIQGYCLARPMPVEQATLWLQNFQPDPRWQVDLAGLPNKFGFELMRMEALHRQWFKKFEHGDDQHSNCTEYDDCHLTQWCNEYKENCYGRYSDFSTIVRAHQKVHQLAEQADQASGNQHDNILPKIHSANKELLKAITHFRNKYGHHGSEQDK